MTIRKILLPLIGVECDNSAVKTAFVTAKALQAHLDAVFVRPDPKETLPYFGEGLSGAVIQDILDAAKEAADKSAAQLRELIGQEADRTGVALVPEPGGPGRATVSFRQVTGPLAPTVNRASRLADLVIFVHGEAAQAAGISRALQECLIGSGKPILLAPEQPAQTIGTRIAVGWDGSVEAAEAVQAALPFLAHAQEIHIVNVVSGELHTDEADQLSGYLGLHGFKSTEHVVRTGGKPVGEVLLAEAIDAKADLLVMGGFGHSRLREFLLGGVTRHVISHATIPVLLAHS
ncbi:MAG: universal stress protein [Alphaproteobacteria bacterium]